MSERQSVERGDFELSHETVKTYADDEYKKVRERWQLGDDFLGGFDFAELKEGGGKGGNLMGFTKDKQYLARVRRDRVKIRARRFSAHAARDAQVKEVNATDHNTILRIIHKYVAHLLDPEGSLLARFFLHFERGGKNYLVMNNWMPPPRYTEVDGKELGHDIKLNYSTYDLKGCADDKTLVLDQQVVAAVHKRIWNVGLWVSKHTWSKERHHYYQGKVSAVSTQFHVTYAQRQRIVRALQKDIELLKHLGREQYEVVVTAAGGPMGESRGYAQFRYAQPRDAHGSGGSRGLHDGQHDGQQGAVARAGGRAGAGGRPAASARGGRHAERLRAPHRLQRAISG